MAQLVKKIKITATIELITGLHIGGSKENVEIGGIDLPVIKLATKDNQPYIPGSSLKGKMRCLLEQANGIEKPGAEGKNSDITTKIMKLFGVNEDLKKNIKNQPSRLIVRDAMLTSDSITMFKNSDNLDMPYTENKFENSIDRVRGIATKGSPRQIERVPAGAEFNAEFIINVWGEDKNDTQEATLLKTFKDGIALLTNDYIGGSGSRGYGQITFKNWSAKQIDGPDWTDEKPYEFKI